METETVKFIASKQLKKIITKKKFHLFGELNEIIINFSFIDICCTISSRTFLVVQYRKS